MSKLSNGYHDRRAPSAGGWLRWPGAERVRLSVNQARTSRFLPSSPLAMCVTSNPSKRGWSLALRATASSLSGTSTTSRWWTPSCKRVCRVAPSCWLMPVNQSPIAAPRETAGARQAYPLRAMVMISGLVSVSGRRVQSPNCSSISRPAPRRNEDSTSISRKRSVPRLTCGPSQAGLVNVLIE